MLDAQKTEAMNIGAGYTTEDEAALCHILAKRTRLVNELADANQRLKAKLADAAEGAEALEKINAHQAERIQRLEKELDDFKRQNEILQRPVITPQHTTTGEMKAG